MTPEQRDRAMDLILERNRFEKTLARAWALLDGRPVIWPDDLREAIAGPVTTMEVQTP